ncbi:hypothetical protein HPP92_020880 [Vanilla planifolia]|uniref:Uncharacterized protein n=1 Tax=Vanilla planifolia TaxID=51239 RepID=A0A835Q3J1_VANPL|nr:hypothetical protein HPP92_020880 [Vanilla planifolia]
MEAELTYTYEDDNNIHIVMELCEGESFLPYSLQGHYTERAAAAVTKTIVEVVQLYPSME